MQGTTLRVTGLNNDIRNTHLQPEFGEFGHVLRIHVLQGKGVAFVEYQEKADAKEAMSSLNGKKVRGSVLTIDIAGPPPDPRNRPKEEGSRPARSSEKPAETPRRSGSRSRGRQRAGKGRSRSRSDRSRSRKSRRRNRGRCELTVEFSGVGKISQDEGPVNVCFTAQSYGVDVAFDPQTQVTVSLPQLLQQLIEIQPRAKLGEQCGGAVRISQDEGRDASLCERDALSLALEGFQMSKIALMRPIPRAKLAALDVQSPGGVPMIEGPRYQCRVYSVENGGTVDEVGYLLQGFGLGERSNHSTVPPLCPDAMVFRVWSIAGKELAAMNPSELKDVKTLKRQLRRLHGYPLCLQQLLHNGNALEDAAKLDEAMTVQLVLLAVCDTAQARANMDEVADELVEYAAGLGNVETLRLLLEAGVDTDIVGDRGCTALILASSQGHTEIARLLLAAEADMRKVDRYGWTALVHASEEGHLETVRELLEASSGSDDCGAALIRACEKGHIAIARMLVASGRGTASFRQGGACALVSAADNGHLEIVKLLLESGFDIYATDEDGYTALSCASHRGHTEVAHMLLQACADPDILNHFGRTALICASDRGNVASARLLLQARANVNLADKDGDTALIRASEQGHVQTVRLLLGAGIDTNISNSLRHTSIHYASENGDDKTVRLLLEARADPGAHTELVHRHYTALSMASSKGHVQIVRLLLDAAADTNTLDSSGETALMEASCKGHGDVVQLLLAAKADKDIVSSSGDTALSYASAKNTEIVRLLSPDASENFS
ncbi:Kinase D-interacting substrate of 220 kDa [Symbiodinium microadriaticum]|uniref:Kinase D-interacting substrate of 220 kDa n=1 Tax=Symbiodinium microadriaticum TaxID=2951 RepID=A0A1Q9E7J0_SYMMI|nr:Kinase D-interacting substrate of 220 kDa [Symbiodinium microadriaticum]